MNTSLTLAKHERLKSRKLIEALFQQGKSFSIFPFRVYYMKAALPADMSVQMGFGASKKNFKKAVNRNRIKRLTKEAYRHKKALLEQALQQKEMQIVGFLIYTGKVLPTFEEVNEKMNTIINKLADQIVQQS